VFVETDDKGNALAVERIRVPVAASPKLAEAAEE
jgi:hypothetical protein